MQRSVVSNRSRFSKTGFSAAIKETRTNGSSARRSRHSRGGLKATVSHFTFARWSVLQGLYWVGIPPRVLNQLYAPVRKRQGQELKTGLSMQDEYGR